MKLYLQTDTGFDLFEGDLSKELSKRNILLAKK